MMSSLQIRRAEHADLSNIAQVIARLNQLPDHQCLHCAENYQEILNGLMGLGQALESSFVVATQGDEVIATLGAECDGEHAWLWGPFILADNWEELAAPIFDMWLANLPSQVCTLHTFTGSGNRRSHQFYLQRGFQETKTAHVYTAIPPVEPLALTRACGEFQPDFLTAFDQLHQRTFADAPITAEDIIQGLDDNHKLFVYVENDHLLGYLYATISDSPIEGYVEFLAVQPDFRRRGIGTQLLLTALKWFFEEKQMPQAGLSVLDERVNAQALYERVGFKLTYSGVGAQREREP